MPIIVLVALGSAVGGIARWMLASKLDTHCPTAAIPWLGTLTVNVVGCFAIGMIASLVPAERADLRALVMTGVLGGFTTFSAFSLQTASLLTAGRFRDVAIVVGASLVGCVIGTIAGAALGHRLSG